MVGVVAVIMFIIAGIIYSTSQDDSQKVGLSKKIILSTVLGIVTYVFLFAFLGFLLPEGLSNGSPSDAAVAACKQASSQGFYHV